MHREIIRISCIHILADIGTDEEALVEEDPFVCRIAVWCRAFGMEVMEVKVLHVSGIRPAAKCLDEAVRDTRNASEVNMAMRGDVADSIIC